MIETHCEICSSPTQSGQPCASCGSSAGKGHRLQTAQPHLRRGLHTATGTVATPARRELHRPYLATTISMISGVVLIVTYLHAPAHPLTHRLADPLTHQLGLSLAAVLQAAATTLLTLLRPLLEYVVLIVVLAVGMRLILVPILGPPRPGPGGLLGRLLARLLTAAVELALHAAVAALHLAARLGHLVLRHLLRPQPRFIFELTGADHQQHRVRISRRDLALHLGQQVSVTGLTLARTTYAYRLRSPGSPARHPQPTPAELTALILSAAALTTLCAAL